MQFTLITPTYNRADCIEDCIQSVVDQLDEFSDFEHIIINDGSNDHTQDVLDAYQRKYSFIKIISYDVNSGVNYARNRGIERASGEYIILLDSDDTLNKGILKKISEEIRNYDFHNHFLFRVSSNGLEQDLLRKEISYVEFLTGNVHGDYLHIVRSDSMKRNKFFEQFRAFENLNWLRIIRENQPVLSLPFEAVSVNIRNNDSLSKRMYKSSNSKILSENFNAQLFYLELYGDELKSYSKRVYYKKLLMLFIMGVRAERYRSNESLLKKYVENKFFQKNLMMFLNNRAFSFLIRTIYSIKNLA